MTQPYDRVAQLDQLGADLIQWAAVYGNFCDALIDNGFERTEALDIILGWQAGQAMALAAQVSFEPHHEDDESP